MKNLDQRIEDRKLEIEDRKKWNQPTDNLPTIYQEIVWEYNMVLQRQEEISKSLDGQTFDYDIKEFVYIVKVLRRGLEDTLRECEERFPKGI